MACALGFGWRNLSVMRSTNPNFWLPVLLAGFALAGSTSAGAELRQSSEPPVIPVGLDAYLQWERLPYQRIGVRASMRSTYDRHGNNRTADASHFLYQESDTFNVALDVQGPGILYFKRCNHWHGSPWHYEVDGKDTLVRETATANPVQAKATLEQTRFIPAELFPEPLTWTWTTTHGADLMWVPIPFEKRFRLAYSRTFYGTGYFIYHQFPLGINHLSRPLNSWDRTPPDPAVLDLLRRSGSDIAPTGDGVFRQSGTTSLAPYQWIELVELSHAPSMIRALKFSVPENEALDFGNTRMRITWDHRWAASIDVPLDLFFGAGQLYNNDGREYLVKGFPLSVRYAGGRVHLACYWPMPFFRHARIELQGRGTRTLDDVHWEIRSVPYPDPINQVAYFHATYSDHPNPREGRDLTFLDTRGSEGAPVWSGHFVGMSWIFSRNGVLNTLEGDPRFLFDDSKTPQAWGTGTEEWGGGGDYWGGRNMTIPFAGHPVGKAANSQIAKPDLLNSAYRFLIADFFPFGRRAVIRLEHGAANQSTEHYSGIVYWYGIDSPSLLLTDELNVCHPGSIRDHNYRSPTAEEPYILVSRYELGPDGEAAAWGDPGPSQHAKQYFPAEEDRVRIMKGTSEFSVNLLPDNLGVLLRRKFDYQYPNQRAEVRVRPAGSDDDWNYVGDWYTAGANTCVFSYPRPGKDAAVPGELAPAEHHPITGNRRWREEEFLIGRQFTEGVKRLEIQLTYVPNHTPLFPGHPFPAESAWSEARYWVYCYQMPAVHLQASK